MQVTQKISAKKAAPLRFEDPLEADRIDDPLVLITRRALCRIVCVAAEAASRFARENSTQDPVAWMLAPRQLFGGRAAIEACQDQDAFTRAILLHGLSLGLDANPDDLDHLLEDDECEDADLADLAE